MHGGHRNTVAEIESIEPPNLGGFCDVATQLGVEAAEGARAGARLGFTDSGVDPVADEDGRGKKLKQRLRFA